jgi:hypothetical protein
MYRVDHGRVDESEPDRHRGGDGRDVGRVHRELDAIKSAQATFSSSQRNAIEYWSGGGVMRWNQFLRELVARHNLPPAPRDEGYPVPDAENPFGDPMFPFANPVYAARAYSFVRFSARSARG